VTFLRWLSTAGIAAYAAHLATVHATPIDAALPLLAVVVTVVSAVAYRWVMLGVPLLVLAELCFPEEGTRLLLLGAIVAGVFAVVMLRRSEEQTSLRAVTLTVAAIVVLRWIPLAEVQLGREVFLMMIAVAIVFVLGRTPLAIAIAVLAALLTPAIPLRTLLLPLAVLFVFMLARMFGMPRLRWAWPSAVAVSMALLFFAWSGIVARAFPVMLQPSRAELPRVQVNQALAAGRSIALDVPARATALILSGANVARMPRGTTLGVIEPGARVVRIGDVADWGSTRRDQFFGSRNPLPKDRAGRIRGYGYAAWIDGAGRLPLPRASVIRITADAALPPGASMQVEGFE